VVGRATPPDARTPAQAEAVQLAESLVAELAAADTVVIGSAMINFGPPTPLKAWFDPRGLARRHLPVRGQLGRGPAQGQEDLPAAPDVARTRATRVTSFRRTSCQN
jgi:hypothetical protein